MSRDDLSSRGKEAKLKQLFPDAYPDQTSPNLREKVSGIIDREFGHYNLYATSSAADEIIKTGISTHEEISGVLSRVFEGSGIIQPRIQSAAEAISFRLAVD